MRPGGSHMPTMEGSGMAAVTLELDGTWSVLPLPIEAEGHSGYEAFLASSEKPMAAEVPGEVHLDLIRTGQLDEPNIGNNARRARWPEEHSWWFRTTFVVPAGFRENDRQQLILDGIDLCGQVFLNGELAGRSKNAFAPLALDVRKFLHDGENELVVRVTSGMELLSPLEVTDHVRELRTKITPDPIHYNREYVHRPHRFLRKAAYSTYGWDWCDPLPNIGIWKGVRLEGVSDVAIQNVRLDTVLSDREVALEGEVTVDNLHTWAERPMMLEIRVDPPSGEPVIYRQELVAPAGLSRIPCRIAIPHAELWWPNGMGPQPLYMLTAYVTTDSGETDRIGQRIGLRTVELDRSPTPNGSRFCVRVNGQDVFCRGGDLAPLDLIPARVTAERYRALVAQAKDANFTMMRVNGVGIYESDDFYDAADEAGILIWQDFTFSIAVYPDHDASFLANVREEAESAVRRLGSHPSLAIWCGSNEVSLFGSRDTDWLGIGPDESHGQSIFTRLLPEVCHDLDPRRPYWPASPYGGEFPSDATSGDQHGWESNDLDDLRGPFYSEYYCAHAAPHINSIREYIGSEGPVRGSEEWRIHTNTLVGMADGAWAPETAITAEYGERDDISLEEYIRYSQLAQAQAHGGAMEALRFRKHDPVRDCQGALMWSFNDTWGEVGWSVLDAYDRRKAAYYWVKRAAAAVKVLVRPRSGRLVTRIVNDTITTRDAVVKCGWMRLDGSADETAEHRVSVPANGVVTVAEATLPTAGERDPAEWLYAAVLRGEGVPDDQAVWLLARHSELALAKPKINSARVGDILEISSPVYCHAVHVEDGGRRLLADNYVELLPGVLQRIAVEAPLADSFELMAVPPLALANRQIIPAH